MSPGKRKALFRERTLVVEDRTRSDVWSLGATLLAMVLLEEPKDINRAS
jgi:serine/threonine protein kinase